MASVVGGTGRQRWLRGQQQRQAIDSDNTTLQHPHVRDDS